MYGDPAAIRALAGRLSDQADQLRAQALALRARTEEAAGEGRTATALRWRVTARTDALDRAARRHDEAAETVRRHADQVEWLIGLIARTERRFADLVSAARERIGRVVTLGGMVAPDPHDEWLVRLRPPARGDRGWLDLDLPGLR